MIDGRRPAEVVSGCLGVLLVAVGLAKYGVGSFPNWVVLWDIGEHWQDPRAGALLDPGHDYLLANSAGAVLTGMLHLAGTRELYGMSHLLVAVAAIVWPFLMPQIRQHEERAKAVFVLLAAGPIVAVLLTWVGGYDPLTVIGACLAALSRSTWSMAIGWFLLGINHSSIAVVALALWLPVMWLADPHARRATRRRAAALAALAAFAGTVLMSAVVGVWGGAMSRLAWLQNGRYDARYLDPYLAGVPWVLFSVLGLGWVLLLHLHLRKVRIAKVVLAAALAAGLLVPLVALDQARVAALCLLPALLAGVVAAFPATGANFLGRAWWGYGAAAVLLPTVVVGSYLPSVMWWGP